MCGLPECAVIAGDPLAQFVHGHIAGARVIRFVAESAIEFGGISDALWMVSIRWFGINSRSFLPG